MAELYQHKNFKRLSFRTSADGVFVRENHCLRFKQREQFISFLDLGINTVKESTREGLPTLILIGFMAIVNAYLVVANFRKNLSLSLLFGIAFVFFLLVIVFTIQNYIKSTFRIIGGPQEIELLRYAKGEAEAIQFINQLKQEAIQAQVLKYNDLVKHFSENEQVRFPLLDAKQALGDTDFKLLQYKTDMLYRNVLLHLPEDADEL